METKMEQLIGQDVSRLKGGIFALIISRKSLGKRKVNQSAWLVLVLLRERINVDLELNVPQYILSGLEKKEDQKRWNFLFCKQHILADISESWNMSCAYNVGKCQLFYRYCGRFATVLLSFCILSVKKLHCDYFSCHVRSSHAVFMLV